VYFPKASTDSTFAFETNSEPGQFMPVHVHPNQDEFILVQEGVLDLKLDGVWVKGERRRSRPSAAPDSARLFQQVRQAGASVVLGLPSRQIGSRFQQLHDLTDIPEVTRLSAEHEVNFLPPEAND
jgi:hypothetical protein